MSDPSLHTVQLHQWVDRMRAGDAAARDELVNGVCERLERLARKMLRRFPAVQRWESTDDVLQNALLRLLRALQSVRPDSVRSFFNLAAEVMRRELIDLARHYQGPHGLGANIASRPDRPGVANAEPIDRLADEGDLTAWAAFHTHIEKLPAEEREVISLTFYHGWTQAEIAELFQVTERTVRRRWQSACMKLNAALDGRLPGDSDAGPAPDGRV